MTFKMQDEHTKPPYTTREMILSVDQSTTEALLNCLPDSVLIVDQAANIRHANRLAQSITEETLDITSCSLGKYLEGAGFDPKSILEAATTGSRITAVDRTFDGRSFLVSSSPLYGDDGALIFSVIILRNLDAINRQFLSQGPSGFKLLTEGPQQTESKRTLCLSKRSTALIEQAIRAVRLNIRVLIIGESGVGKTEIARHVHDTTLGSNRPFIHVNCASIPDTLFESEMFGYAAGAFTGALSRGKKGLIEAAEGGVLFLDEVGEVPLHCQAKLLKFLEDGTIQRVGSTGAKKVSLHLFSATNCNLLDMVAKGSFRKDLYYRLSSLTLTVPSLRETREVIPDLVQSFVERLNARRDRPFKLSAACLQWLKNYDFPGNIREMQNIIEHLAVVADDVADISQLPDSAVGKAQGIHLPAPLPTPKEPLPDHSETGAAGTCDAPLDLTFFTPDPDTAFRTISLREEVRRYESCLIKEAINQTGSKRKAAKKLGIDIATMVRKTRNED